MNRKVFPICVILCMVCLIVPFPCRADDMRLFSVELKQKKAILLEKAKRESEQAQKEKKINQQRILDDKQKLTKAIKKIKEENEQLEKQNIQLKTSLNEWVKVEETLVAEVNTAEATIKELTGIIRTNAKDIHAILLQGLQNSFLPQRLDFLKGIMSQSEFPGMKEIRNLVDLLFDEIKRSGEVRIEHHKIVTRTGEEKSADILILGNFMAAYEMSPEIGFLLSSDKSQRLFALSNLPPRRHAKKIKLYMSGKTDDISIDISRGGALRQLTYRLSLKDQIVQGGPIVWPILGIGLVAFLIIIERLIYLLRIRFNANEWMKKIDELVALQSWDKCKSACKEYQNKPVPKVLLEALNSQSDNRQDMENVLQEAILREVPKLERFLSTLGMIAAIAPLLGLLGTVTGMINTFRTITYYGTGDPKLMAGGISEALVTTMLGLSVAIPIMLCYTFLSRRVENIIAQMEEKAVAFTNTVFKIKV